MKEYYKPDRTSFSMLSFNEADKEFNDHRNLSWQERFLLHQYLNAIAYGYAGTEAPGMDKTIFTYGKRDDAKHLSP